MLAQHEITTRPEGHKSTHVKNSSLAAQHRGNRTSTLSYCFHSWNWDAVLNAYIHVELLTCQLMGAVLDALIGCMFLYVAQVGCS